MHMVILGDLVVKFVQIARYLSAVREFENVTSCDYCKSLIILSLNPINRYPVD